MPIGLEDWFMNFTQIVRSAVTPESLANVPRPYSEFAIFGTLKGGEIASFIGLLVLLKAKNWILHVDNLVFSSFVKRVQSIIFIQFRRLYRSPHLLFCAEKTVNDCYYHQ